MHATNIAYQRMLDQRIAGERFTRPGEVVKWMGAMQAQDYHQALWAVGLRTQAATVGDITQAITDRTFILTWPMRSTLHFCPAEDAKWMLRLSAPRRLSANKRRLQQLELDDETLGRCQALFEQALHGGRLLSRPEMMQVLDDAGISPKGQRGYHILGTLAQQGLICLGPVRDKQQTFVLLDEWVTHSRDLSREESLAELARRYFASHGPATLQDFARWGGLTIGDAKAGLHDVTHHLISETINGEVCWWAADAPDPRSFDLSGVYLLPGFDEYVIGYGNRRDVLPDEYADRIIPGGNGIFLPTIVLDGQVIGTWKRTLKKSAVSITLNPFTRLDVAQERLMAAAQSYSDFMGLSLASIETIY
ncbi:MAG: winged helix DNA-binding domain-containing protein [Anaerolineae bacterium]|nr:winged helix DNA-binding domain-containing protein [Anaerolineae bacterium]